jgi:hypothetical protein
MRKIANIRAMEEGVDFEVLSPAESKAVWGRTSIPNSRTRVVRVLKKSVMNAEFVADVQQRMTGKPGILSDFSGSMNGQGIFQPGKFVKVDGEITFQPEGDSVYARNQAKTQPDGSLHYDDTVRPVRAGFLPGGSLNRIIFLSEQEQEGDEFFFSLVEADEFRVLGNFDIKSLFVGVKALVEANEELEAKEDRRDERRYNRELRQLDLQVRRIEYARLIASSEEEVVEAEAAAAEL